MAGLRRTGAAAATRCCATFARPNCPASFGLAGDRQKASDGELRRPSCESSPAHISNWLRGPTADTATHRLSSARMGSTCLSLLRRARLEHHARTTCGVGSLQHRYARFGSSSRLLSAQEFLHVGPHQSRAARANEAAGTAGGNAGSIRSGHAGDRDAEQAFPARS